MKLCYIPCYTSSWCCEKKSFFSSLSIQYRAVFITLLLFFCARSEIFCKFYSPASFFTRETLTKKKRSNKRESGRRREKKQLQKLTISCFFLSSMTKWESVWWSMLFPLPPPEEEKIKMKSVAGKPKRGGRKEWRKEEKNKDSRLSFVRWNTLKLMSWLKETVLSCLEFANF